MPKPFYLPRGGIRIEEGGTDYRAAIQPVYDLAQHDLGIDAQWAAFTPALGRALDKLQSGEGHLLYQEAVLLAENAQNGWGPLLDDAIEKTSRTVSVNILGHPKIVDPLGNEVDLHGSTFALSGFKTPERGYSAGLVADPPESITVISSNGDAVRIAPETLRQSLRASNLSYAISKMDDAVIERGVDPREVSLEGESTIAKQLMGAAAEKEAAAPRTDRDELSDLLLRKAEMTADLDRCVEYVNSHPVEISSSPAVSAPIADSQEIEAELDALEADRRDSELDDSRDRKDSPGPYSFADRAAERADLAAKIDEDEALKGNTALDEASRAELMTDIAAMDVMHPSQDVIGRSADSRDFDVQHSLLARGLALDALAESEHEQIVSGVASKLGLPRDCSQDRVREAAQAWAESNEARTVKDAPALAAAAHGRAGAPASNSPNSRIAAAKAAAARPEARTIAVKLAQPAPDAGMRARTARA